MKNGKGPPGINKYILGISISVCLILISLFIVYELRLSRKTERQISDLFIREQVLQTVAIRNSVRENLHRIVNESNILASYSFPEYEAGLRSDLSMENLLKIELNSYQDCSAYSYLDFSGEKTIRASNPDDAGTFPLDFARQWEESYRNIIISEDDSLIVPPFISNGNSVFMGLIFPVLSEGKKAGSLSTVINLKEPLDRYIRPIADEMSGIPIVFDSSMNIFWDENSIFKGKSIGEIFNGKFSSVLDELQSLFETDDSGSYRINNTDFKRERVFSNLSWSSFLIGEQRIIIGLFSEDDELFYIMKNRENERQILYSAIALLFIIAVYGIFKVKVLSMKKMLLEDSQERLSVLVDEKTDDLQMLLNRYTALYESANDAIVLFKDGVFIECNQKGLELYDAESPEELLGKTPADISPEFQDDGQRSEVKARNLMNKCLEGKSIIFDWVHKTLRGRFFYAEVSLKIIDMNGTLIAQSIVRDVSERVERLREKDAMMKEIHHRVKNNLAIINSFLNLQKYNNPGSETVGMIADTQRRVDVMAKMHELLYSHDNLSGISSAEYFKQIVDSFYLSSSDSSAYELNFEAEDLVLNPDRCMYAGFILSELIDNSVKYGSNAGNVWVKVSFYKDGNTGILEVLDRGGGFVPEAGFNYPGLGLKVISALTIQLKGDISWSEAGGTRAVFRFNLADV